MTDTNGHYLRWGSYSPRPPPPTTHPIFQYYCKNHFANLKDFTFFFVTRWNLLRGKQLKATHIVVSDHGVWRTKCFQSDWKSLNEGAAAVFADDLCALSGPKQQNSQQRKQEEPKQEHSRRSRHTGINPFVSLQLNPQGEEKCRKAQRCLFYSPKIPSHLEVWAFTGKLITYLFFFFFFGSSSFIDEAYFTFFVLHHWKYFHEWIANSSCSL